MLVQIPKLRLLRPKRVTSSRRSVMEGWTDPVGPRTDGWEMSRAGVSKLSKSHQKCPASCFSKPRKHFPPSVTEGGRFLPWFGNRMLASFPGPPTVSSDPVGSRTDPVGSRTDPATENGPDPSGKQNLVRWVDYDPVGSCIRSCLFCRKPNEIIVFWPSP